MSQDYEQTIPESITDLATYEVSMELFICTAVVLGVLLILSLLFCIFWIFRVKNGFFNIDYMMDFAIKQ